jgi:hypothetical protein
MLRVELSSLDFFLVGFWLGKVDGQGGFGCVGKHMDYGQCSSTIAIHPVGLITLVNDVMCVRMADCYSIILSCLCSLVLCL